MASRLTTLIVISIVVATFVAGIITRAQRDDEGPIDLIVFNGAVYAGADRARAEAIAVRGNTIVRVGSNRDIKRLRRPQTVVVDAHGGAVLPGFIDTSVRLLDDPLAPVAVDLASAATAGAMVDLLRTHAAAHRHRTWVVGTGLRPGLVAPDRTPREQLDGIVPDRPLLVIANDGRTGFANSEALRLAKVGRTTPRLRRGAIARNAAGEPTGALRDAAVVFVRSVVPRPSRRDQVEALLRAMRTAHAMGVTSLQSTGPALDDADLWNELRRRDALTVRMYHSLTAQVGFTDADVARLDETRRRLGDDPLLRTGSVEIALSATSPETRSSDAGSRTAAVQLRHLVSTLDRHGWQICLTTASDDEFRAALDAFEAARTANPAPERGRRHRIRHKGPIASEARERLEALGVIVDSHPATGGTGSDLDAHPIQLLRASVEQAPAGLPLPAAIDASTREAAYASFDERRKGTLARGMLADIVLLSGDIFTMPVERLGEVRVATTIFDGKVVYTAATPNAD